MFLGSSFKSISIHAPTRGATKKIFENPMSIIISIHAPTRGATISRYRIMAKLKLFQSTLLQEERLRGFQSCYLSVRISIHAPTRGATLKKCTDASCFPYFNPRSYKRSDVSVLHLFKTFIISIHAPTRGATGCNISGNNISLISIHAPTRGATLHEYYNVLCFYISIHAPTRGATSNGGNVS